MDDEIGGTRVSKNIRPMQPQPLPQQHNTHQTPHHVHQAFYATQHKNDDCFHPNVNHNHTVYDEKSTLVNRAQNTEELELFGNFIAKRLEMYTIDERMKLMGQINYVFYSQQPTRMNSVDH